MVVRAVMEYNSGVKLAHENGWKVMSRDHRGHGHRGTTRILFTYLCCIQFPSLPRIVFFYRTKLGVKVQYPQEKSPIHSLFVGRKKT